ncbi:hypothetical protein [Sphingomicrobium nitratireducens]|uniref:hypothetical protein n=1 Tax=Sphingomicrobium nitratireducens TaxID=2964666 RepID=UPI00223F8F46|nr:hypothetical protein [Sphingomicrobium nitratireducens]
MSAALLLALSLLVARVDPLTVRLELDDAERFAELMEGDAVPDAAVIRSRYLEQGGEAIAIFTPGRIENADHLAATVSANPGLYRDAVTRCLPWARKATPLLRATYLGLSGLLPHHSLPRIAVVVGADNSGGTAGEGMQVLGLEVLCRTSPDRAAFDAQLRKFFAHETVHTIQGRGDEDDDLLLRQTMTEGVADYVASLVTGQPPDRERDKWAREREQDLFNEFATDLAEMRRLEADPDDTTEPMMAILRRWHINAGSPPEGWPGELGYWIGRRISQSFVDRAEDKRAAIEALIALEDADAIVAQSEFAEILAR